MAVVLFLPWAVTRETHVGELPRVFAVAARLEELRRAATARAVKPPTPHTPREHTWWHRAVQLPADEWSGRRWFLRP